MKNHLLFLIMIIALFASSCTKSPGKTDAKIKINMSNIINSSGLGDGGALLYGRSTTGHMFGKVITTASETLEIPNGSWVFYAFTWSGGPVSGNDLGKLMGRVYCAKVAQQLNGGEVSIALNLSNANCADAEFSEGRVFDDTADANSKRFAFNYLEECDEISALTDYKCGLKNQGSGRSYRVKIQSFKKGPNTAFLFGEAALYSNCRRVTSTDSMSSAGITLPVNFPSGSLTTPFIATIEVFLGSDDCGYSGADPKGVYQFTLEQGFKNQNPYNHKIIFGTKKALTSSSNIPGADNTEKEKNCNDLLGSWDGTSCINIPPAVGSFAPDTLVPVGSGTSSAIKHLIQIPQTFICNQYLSNSSVIGDHPFSGGKGYLYRPYKICTEWQINQIGELGSSTAYSSSHYKLMNDLDMNKADFGPYAAPACAGSGLVDGHHNLNPLDKINVTNCATENTSAQFTGSFNGNGKLIKNARIAAETVEKLGFVRYLYSGAIYNIAFDNLEVRGKNKVGGIAGYVSGGSTGSVISNIVLKNAEIEGSMNGPGTGSYVGGIAGQTGYLDTVIDKVHIKGARIRGRDYLGGLVGSTMGHIKQSSFRGVIKIEDSQAVKAGGITADIPAGSSVSQVYSEGMLITSADYSGGIAGGNVGDITNSYSTMNIHYTGNSGSADKISGIVGNNTGNIDSAYSDGALTYKSGTAPPTRAGVIGFGSGGVNCYSRYSVAGGSCTGSTNPETLAVGSFSDSTQWLKITGSYPRLGWEVRDCLDANNQASITTQEGQGRGGALNPVALCNSSQLLDIAGKTNSYRLLEDININSWTATIGSFNGNLYGNNKIIYGLNLAKTDDSDGFEGIVKSLGNLGMIRNVSFYGNYFNNAADLADFSSGLIVGYNTGEIKNVDLIGNEIVAEENVGLIAGKNNGIISNVNVTESSVQGRAGVGGITGYAYGGSILKVFFGGSIKSHPAPSGNYEYFGGIAGKNYAVIDQTQFSGKLKLQSTTTAAQFHVGGIAGINTTRIGSAGAISNSYTDKYSEINVIDNDTVGGLVGETIAGSSLSKSFALGKVVFDNAGVDATAGLSFHPLVGQKAASTVDSSTVFYLKNNIGSFKGQYLVDGTNCSYVNPHYTCLLTSVLSDGNLISSSYGNGDLNEMFTFSPLLSTTLNYYGTYAFDANDWLNIYQSYTLSDTTGELAASGFNTLSNFCSAWSTDNETCTSGFDIVQEGVKGTNRIYSFYGAMMNGDAIPSNAPVWDLESDEGYPKLLQLKNH